MTNFYIGQQVINIGTTATVVGFHKITGDLILEEPGTGRWIADPAKTLVCCVGPIPMMKAVAAWAEGKGMKCFVSMEQRMACGAGICLCCTVKVKDDGPDGYKNVRCCKEGPVFDSREVAWS